MKNNLSTPSVLFVGWLAMVSPGWTAETPERENT
jgi:hypothetical protein